MVVLCLLAAPPLGRVIRVEVQDRAEVLRGRSFGLAGAYEALTGKVHFAADSPNSNCESD